MAGKTRPIGQRGAVQADEAAAFAEAMRGVKELEGRARMVVGGSETRPRAHPAAVEARRARAQAPAQIAELGHTLSGEPSADVVGGEWQLCAGGVDRRAIKRLRAGDVAIEARLDLHGLTRGRASDALERFLVSARAGGRRVLLVIHGRGLHSGADGPTLTQLVRDALGRGAHAPAILAAVSAPARLGGEGATVVWLRKS